MNNDINTKILSALTTTMPLSATAIAKKIGVGKAVKIMKNLDDLVDDCKISVDVTGRFPTYTKIAAVVKKTTKKSATNSKKIENNAASVNSKGGVKSIDFGTESHVVIEGYSVERPVVNKSGQTGSRIKTPNGRKIFVKDGMTLVIINNSPKYIVDTPVRLIEACHYYASTNSMAAYKISQSGVGVINGHDDIKMNDVVSMKIDRIDKGAM